MEEFVTAFHHGEKCYVIQISEIVASSLGMTGRSLAEVTKQR